MSQRWERRGLLLEPPTELAWVSSHAMVPTPHRAGDEAWVLFGGRDEEGRSRIGRARVDPQAMTVSGVDPEPLLDLGPLGAFDQDGVTPSCLVESGGALHLYYGGWSRGDSVPFHAFVGLAVSADGGRRFERASPSPVLERDEVDPFLTLTPWVLIEDGTWRMWYVSGTGWSDGPEPRHRYHVKYAESDDGVSWRREGRVCIDYRDESEYAIARPFVLRDGDRYRMWYSTRGEAYRIGYAESADGLEWERLDDQVDLEVAPEGWDSEMVEYAAALDGGGARHMLYNGNGYGASGIGHALLTDP